MVKDARAVLNRVIERDLDIDAIANAVRRSTEEFLFDLIMGEIEPHDCYTLQTILQLPHPSEVFDFVT